jgi:hypothetical protein
MQRKLIHTYALTHSHSFTHILSPALTHTITQTTYMQSELITKSKGAPPLRCATDSPHEYSSASMRGGKPTAAAAAAEAAAEGAEAAAKGTDVGAAEAEAEAEAVEPSIDAAARALAAASTVVALAELAAAATAAAASGGS